MSASRLSYRYAKALIDLSKEKGQLEQVYQDICHLNKAMSSSIELRSLMKSPIINADKKAGIVEKIFKKSLNPITFGFLGILVRKHRESYLSEITEAFIDQYNQLNAIVKARLTTAVPVSDALLQKIKDLVIRQSGKKQVELQTIVSDFIVAGFILEFEDKLFDTSIQQKFQDLNLKFQENKYVRKF